MAARQGSVTKTTSVGVELVQARSGAARDIEHDSRSFVKTYLCAPGSESSKGFMEYVT